MRAAAGDTQIEWQAATHSEVGSVWQRPFRAFFFFFKCLSHLWRKNVPAVLKTRRPASRSSSPLRERATAVLTCGSEAQTSQRCMYAWARTHSHSLRLLHAFICVCVRTHRESRHTAATTCLMPPSVPSPPPPPPGTGIWALCEMSTTTLDALPLSAYWRWSLRRLADG